MQRFFLMLALVSGTVLGQEAADPAPVVAVPGVRDPALKSYQHMLKGLDAFDSHKAFAPQADLRFRLIRQSDAPPTPFTLRIANDEESVTVPVASDDRFELPRVASLASADAELILNAKKGTVRWRPDVRSPDVPPDARRLGDLRLECAVRWGVERDELSFVQRSFFRMVGGPCTSGAVAVYFLLPRAALSATLVQGERRLKLTLAHGGRSFPAPG